MNIKISQSNQRYLQEMLFKNYRYMSLEVLVNEAIANFYVREKKRGFC